MATNTVEKCVLLPMSGPQKELCNVVRFLFRPGRRCLSICVLVSLHVHATAEVSESVAEAGHGLLSKGTIVSFGSTEKG